MHVICFCLVELPIQELQLLYKIQISNHDELLEHVFQQFAQ